ncbi:hypothetical protein AMECASPLE_009060, partial [Ameca splendens]
MSRHQYITWHFFGPFAQFQVILDGAAEKVKKCLNTVYLIEAVGTEVSPLNPFWCCTAAEGGFKELSKVLSHPGPWAKLKKYNLLKCIIVYVFQTGKPPVEDLFSDLCDGRRLLELLEGLIGHELVRLERGTTRVHSLNNVNRALQILQKNNVDLVNIGAADIVDGNHKLILGLIWSIILHWQ